MFSCFDCVNGLLTSLHCRLKLV
uniref:Uncharacterized protein n=1 Tax=Anopheles albimanus TaxID=7167 RepID=A0A182FZJ6_ANOAL